jgi:putative membrane protein
MVIFRLLIGMILVFLLVAFAIANMGGVIVSFYFYRTPQIPLFVVIFLSLLLGVIVAWGLAVSEQLRLRGQIRGKDKKIKELLKEMEELEGRLSRLSPPHPGEEESLEVAEGEVLTPEEEVEETPQPAPEEEGAKEGG